MKASELIEKLQAAIAEHGDAEMVFGGYGGLVEITYDPYPIRTDDSLRCVAAEDIKRAEAMIATGEWVRDGEDSQWIRLVKANPKIWLVLE